MKINWKVRFKNKTWLMTFVVGAIALIYQVLGIVGVVPPLSQDTVVSIVSAIVNILVMLGVVIDPTTQGTSDSERALNYTEPGGSDLEE